MDNQSILDIFTNALLVPAALSWVAAQLLKVLLILIVYKRLDVTRFIGAGGMPSAHTAFVMALSVSAGLQCGWASPVFAVSAALCLIVMYDAAGVRRAAGKQAARINQIIESLTKPPHALEFNQEQLKELLGHTPVEVLAGALLGVAVAVAYTI